MNVLLVFLGGGAGAACRWWFSQGVSSVGFPYGTLSVNLLGCLLIGVASALLLDNQKAALILITGFLGGFTTFSSFGLDSFGMLQAENYKSFAGYVLASNVLGILLVVVGHKVTTYLS